MAIQFNPFTGNLDLTGSGGGGGGSSVITAAVETFADLPETLGTPPIDAVYLVREATGAFNPFATRRFAGLYIRSDNTGVRADDWTFLGAYPDLFLDGNFLLANSATPSKQAAFDLSAIASATTRTFSYPDQNGTLALTTLLGAPIELIIACSDESTSLTTGTAKVTFRAPYAFTLTAVRASVSTAPTGSTLIVDINEAGSTVLSTKLSIDASEKTSTTAASAAVISDSAIADDAEITIDIDQIGSTIAGAGLKVALIGTRA